MDINIETIILRQQAWEIAKNLITPIVEEHGIEKYSLGNMFSNVSTMTKVDQHLSHITGIADWLIGEE